CSHAPLFIASVQCDPFRVRSNAATANERCCNNSTTSTAIEVLIDETLRPYMVTPRMPPACRSVDPNECCPPLGCLPPKCFSGDPGGMGFSDGKGGKCKCKSPSFSIAPIRYADGSLELVSNDLPMATGFGAPWGHTRSYLNRVNQSMSWGNGYN